MFRLIFSLEGTGGRDDSLALDFSDFSSFTKHYRFFLLGMGLDVGKFDFADYFMRDYHDLEGF
jgi:hypothetical protein